MEETLTNDLKLITYGDYDEDFEFDLEWQKESKHKNKPYIGKPIKSLAVLRKLVKNVDRCGFVKKMVMEEGGVKKPHIESTVSAALTGFWEGENKPFDFHTIRKPLVVDLKENGLLPGIQIALKSMYVGEMSVFILSHEVMYAELDVPPRIKPNRDCVYYIKLIASVMAPEESIIVKSAERRRAPQRYRPADVREYIAADARAPPQDEDVFRQIDNEVWLPYQEIAADILAPLYNPVPVQEPERRQARNVHNDPFDTMMDVLVCSIV